MLVDGQQVSVVGLAVLGVIVGLVAGIFGVGGGVLMTPLLSVVFRVPLPIAVGTGLCQMVGTATAALLRHRKLGHGELRFDLLMVAGSMIGVAAGVQTVTLLEGAGSIAVGTAKLPLVTVVVYGSYILLLVGCSWMFWRQSGQPIDGLLQVRRGPLARISFGPAIDLPALPLTGVSVLTIAYVGMVLGFVSGLMGLGGGLALMPVLIYGFGFPIRQAAGTGILALLVTVSFGTLQHALAGHVHLGMASVLLVGSSLSAQVGATLTGRLPPKSLRRGFALLLWVAIGAIGWDVWRLLQGE